MSTSSADSLTVRSRVPGIGEDSIRPPDAEPGLGEGMAPYVRTGPRPEVRLSGGEDRWALLSKSQRADAPMRRCADAPMIRRLN